MPMRAGTVSSDLESLIAARRDGYGLPREFYHNRALYEHELDRIWRRGWVFVGHSCELPRPGDYLTVTMAGDPLLVVRGDDGALRAFHNICSHRGTLLCTAEQGSARAIVCPYHQWAYSLNGALLCCHGMQDDIDRQELGLQPVAVDTCAGLIFVSLAATPPAFDPARRAMAPLVQPQGLERARVAAVMDYEVAANWKIVWENNRECYHCNVNHPQYIKSNYDIYEEGRGSSRIHERLARALARHDAATAVTAPADEIESVGDVLLDITYREGGLAPFPDAENNIWYAANRTVLADGYESESMDGRRVAPLMGDYRDASAGVVRVRTLPNFWSHASCDHAVTTRLLPAGLDRTQVRVTWLVDEAAREGVDYDRQTLLPFWQLTSEQDWELCERVQRGITSTAYRPGPLSRLREYNVDAFFRWYVRQF